MSYTLIKLTELSNLEKFANQIEHILTKASRFNDEEAEYLEKFRAETAEFLENKDFESLIAVFFEARRTLRLDQKYMNSVSAITSYLIQESPAKDKVLEKFWVCLNGEEGLSVSFKLTQLEIIFNGLEGYHKLQYILLLRIIEFCKKNERLGVLNSTFADIDTVTKGWGLPNKERRNLLAQIIDALDKSIKQEFRCQIILKYLQAFEAASKEEEKKLINYVVLLLNFGQVLAEYGNIFSTPGIKHLQKNNSTLYQIFAFFVTGDVAGFQEFKTKNATALLSLGLSEDEYLEKVRVQSISRFAKSGELISYKQFADNLNISIDEVENWVILAITNKIIDAQIDQFNEIIYIKTNYGKYLDNKEWASMNESLKQIIGKVQSFLDSADKIANQN